VLFLLVRLSAASVAASVMLTAMATIVCVTDTQAQERNRPATAQRAAPFQGGAPAFRSAPVQHVAPHVVMPRPMPMPPVYMNPSRPVGGIPTFTQPQHGNNFRPVNPTLQRINPNLPFNNPSALRPNLPFNNPSALRPNIPLGNPSALTPNVPLSNPSAVTPRLPVSNPNFVPQRSGIPPQGPATFRIGPRQPLASPVLSKPSPGGAQQSRPTFPAVHLHDKFWPITKDSKFMWVRGHRRLFVPVGLLGVVLIGGSYWYPDSYVAMDGPACTGFTPDGCQLQWRMVDFEDGDDEPQCVQYCPQVGPPPAPAEVATLPPPPPPPVAENGACQTTIYSEANFGGNSAPTGDSQPNLSETGWRNEISSIVVGAGIWDFFSDENFGGESMRLSPGTYPILSEEWTKRIGSFMCVQPGPPRA
jgi:beta/gamma crystallin